MKKIFELHKLDRPREKILKYGAKKLTNYELLAIIFRSGSRENNVIELAKEVINETNNLREISETKLMSIKGIGSAKYTEILALVELAERIYNLNKKEIILDSKQIWLQTLDIAKTKKEHLIAFYLDIKNEEIRREIISIGTLNSSLVHPREVFEPAIRLLAAKVILVHNHPSNVLEPSSDDIQITKDLVKAGEMLDIELVDHIIVTSEGWLSMKENGDI